MGSWNGSGRRKADCTKAWNPKDFLPPRDGVTPDDRWHCAPLLGWPKRRPPIRSRLGSDKNGEAEWLRSITRSIGRNNGGETWSR